MQNNAPRGGKAGAGVLGWVGTGLLAAILVVLLIFLLQLDTLEERLIQQAQELRALGEKTDRASSRIERLDAKLSSGGFSSSSSGGGADAYADVPVLHPDVPNYLSPPEFSIANPDVPQDGVLYKPWSSGEPSGFNPVISNDGMISQAIEAYAGSAFAGRQAWTNPDKWEGDLAWRVEITDDYREYTIYLRRGVKWHTPSGVDLSDERYAWLRGDHELTARDVVFTFDMVLHPQVDNGFIKNYFADLESWEALDDYTVRVRWKKKVRNSIAMTIGMSPIPEFLYAYDERGDRIPDETIGLRFNQHWYNNRGFVGAGPYRFTSYEPGVRMVLERYEDYYGDKPAVKRIELPIYSDTKRGLLMLRSGELSVRRLYEGEYREEILAWQDKPESEWPDSPFLNGELECQEIPASVFSYLGWNANKPMFADKRVRRAMTHALNRQQIIDEIFVGLGQVATGPFPLANPGHDETIRPLPFDLDKARALLAEAGWEDTDADGLLDKDLDPTDDDPGRSPFEFSFLLFGGSNEWAAMANVFKEDLLKIGVRMSIVTAEWSLMQKRMAEKDFDVHSGAWGQVWEQDPFQIWHSSQADVPKGSNRIGFRNARVDELIEALRENFDDDERAAMLREIHGILHEEQPYTFFRNRKIVYCNRDYVEGVRATVTGSLNSLPWWVEQGP